MNINMKKEIWKTATGELPVEIFTIKGYDKLLTFNHNGAKLIISKISKDVVLREDEDINKALRISMGRAAELCELENKKGICIVWTDNNEYGLAVTSENCILDGNDFAAEQ